MSNFSTRFRLLALALPVLWLVACGGGDAPQEMSEEAPEEAPEAAEPPNLMIGVWDADVQAMMVASMPEGAEMPPGTAEMLQDAYMTVEFHADGTNTMEANMGGEDREEAGSWELLSQDGDTYELSLTSQTGSGEEKTQNATAVFTDDDNVTVTLEGDDGGPPMILTRRQ